MSTQHNSSLNFGNHANHHTKTDFSSLSIHKIANFNRKFSKTKSQSAQSKEDAAQITDLSRRVHLLQNSDRDLSRNRRSTQVLTSSLENIFNFQNQTRISDDENNFNDDVRIIQMGKYQKLISKLDAHLAGLEDYMHHSNDWKYRELRQMLYEQEQTIEGIEREIVLIEGQADKKSNDLKELKNSLLEAENQLNYSLEANRKFSEDKLRYEEENIMLKERSVEINNAINEMKTELDDNSAKIDRLMFLHTASSNRSRISKLSRGTQTIGMNSFLLSSVEEIVRVDSEIQVESLKPKVKKESCDKEIFVNIK